MQEPTVAKASEPKRDVQPGPEEVARGAKADRSVEEELDGSTDLDQDLRSLVDGVAMLGRFEAELEQYESLLGEATIGGN